MKTKQVGIVMALITTALTCQVRAQTSLTNGLVAYYPFNGNANDESGNERNGTIVGATFVPDRFNNPTGAIAFTNVGEYVAVTNSLHPQGQVTIT